MFTLVFLVMFGPKKGSNVAYSGTWGFNLNKQLSSLKPYVGPNKLFFFKIGWQNLFFEILILKSMFLLILSYKPTRSINYLKGL